jgi:uncharacterized membrane protein YczE
VRLASLVFGLFLFAAGIVALLESKLGLSPWDVLNQGLAKHSPLTFGLANVAVGLVVLGVAWALGAPPGLGTVANAVLIGLFIDGMTRVPAIESVADTGLAVRAALLPAGIAAMGVGSAFYIGAAYGAGPRDSLMLVLARRTGRRIGLVRTGLEAAAVVAGFALGGTVGIGTLAFALLIGPSVEASFWALSRSPIAACPEVPTSARVVTKTGLSR